MEEKQFEYINLLLTKMCQLWPITTSIHPKMYLTHTTTRLSDFHVECRACSTFQSSKKKKNLVKQQCLGAFPTVRGLCLQWLSNTSLILYWSELVFFLLLFLQLPFIALVSAARQLRDVFNISFNLILTFNRAPFVKPCKLISTYSFFTFFIPICTKVTFQ